jgi:hypothetical protein
MRIPEEVPRCAELSLPEPCPVDAYEGAPEYQYNPLEDDESIRILVLAPGKTDDSLKGKLEVVNIDAAGSYEPISYAWSEPGPPNRRYEIFIGDGDNERILKLRGGSIFAALSRLRLPDRSRRVWADQICINQENSFERSQQVQFMNKIYKNASHVLVWLGLDKENEAKSAFGLIHQIDERLLDEAEQRKFHFQFTQNLERQSMQEWKALNDLTKRSWVSDSSRRVVVRFLTSCSVQTRLDSPRNRNRGSSNDVLGRCCD